MYLYQLIYIYIGICIYTYISVWSHHGVKQFRVKRIGVGCPLRGKTFFCMRAPLWRSLHQDAPEPVSWRAGFIVKSNTWT